MLYHTPVCTSEHKMTVSPEDQKRVSQETAKRRTFAIISHPDAGKTTLTEKLLLYAGMIQTAGMVRGRKTHKAASSDWMEMERERGISITASAMQFLYKDVVINVLDTPGHQDFSEDTYRTLTAADSAVMVIDAAKGVETQTRKLFKVCRMRNIPILTFVNKMDLPGQEPLDLLAEVEEVLDIQASPLNWPIGSGKNFKGVVDRQSGDVILFEKGEKGGSSQAKATRHTLDEARQIVQDDQLFEKLDEDLELLDEAGNPFSQELFSSLKVTPVFFGSALTNFGVEPFFDAFSALAPPPGPRLVTSEGGEERLIDPVAEPFSAYVFKLQANMDPRHRDSMAFLRICSGQFERDLTVCHSRHEKKIRLSRSHSMFGGSRTTVEDGFPGDIVGVVNPGAFAIGDTISLSGGFSYQPMPRFPPEVVARIRPVDVMRRKSFEKGIDQFRNEGAVLVLEPLSGGSTDLLVAAVGPLQFEVLAHRLQAEYKVEAAMDMLPYQYGAWLNGDPATFHCPSGTILARDNNENIIFLYKKEWERGHALERNPDHQLESFVA
jgi:peptide chain release factor 3